MGTRGLGSRAVPALGVTAVVTVAVVAATGVFIAGRAERAHEATRAAEAAAAALTWKEGACVEREGGRFALVLCDDADGRVISMVGLRAPDCPVITDEFVRITTPPATPAPKEPTSKEPTSKEPTPKEPPPEAPASEASAPQKADAETSARRSDRTACVRNLRGPHPGDPGRGGGVLRAGDCLTLREGERPCSAKDWYGKVLAVVERSSACPRRSLDAIALDGRAVACLGEGGRVLSVGDCVARPGGRLVSREALAKAPCASRRAWAKVTARAEARADCPRGSDRYLRVRDPGIRRPVTCLRRTSGPGAR
ncbi:hypothetical protein ACFFMN_30450 [Planobispora siamensis]|uniref:Uncharacterized protein n=1 Tax=Planobispora siamensis TaxID=936338 RepID=A0A8J3WKC8_9ACTN|nr:hypothetical protein [Planobispora siamensis]GIH91487.1 hypothetical protein Psi01_21170 [Planobispora siamensis]